MDKYNGALGWIFNDKLENMKPRRSNFSPAEMENGVSFKCMKMISSGTEAVTKLAFNWARQGQRAAMALMYFTTKTPNKFTVSKESHTLTNHKRISVCIVASRRAEGRMVHRRYESVPRTYAHHRHGQWPDGASGNPFMETKWNLPCSIFASSPLSNGVRIASRIDEESHHTYRDRQVEVQT